MPKPVRLRALTRAEQRVLRAKVKDLSLSVRVHQRYRLIDEVRRGRGVVEASRGNLKRVHLELGGKGANIVFSDADLDAAVAGSAFAIFHNQGQACIAGSRLILDDRIADEFLSRFLSLAGSIRLGDPKDPGTEMGPLTSPGHRDRVKATPRARPRTRPHRRRAPCCT